MNLLTGAQLRKTGSKSKLLFYSNGKVHLPAQYSILYFQPIHFYAGKIMAIREKEYADCCRVFFFYYNANVKLPDDPYEPFYVAGLLGDFIILKKNYYQTAEQFVNLIYPRFGTSNLYSWKKTTS